MLLLLCFALAYAITGAAGQVGRDARDGLRTVRRRAWSTATRRVANMRAAGPRHVGWWLWLTGATVYHTTRYTVRSSRVVGRSVRTGWSAGWQRGRDRHAEWTAHRAKTRPERGTSRTFADRWRTTGRAGRRADREPVPDQEPTTQPGPDATDDSERLRGRPVDERLDDGWHGADSGSQHADPVGGRPEGGAGDASSAAREPVVTLARCGGCGVYVSGDHACFSRRNSTGMASDRHQGNGSKPQLLENGDRQDAGATNGTGVAVMANTTGEAPNIEAARDALAALQAEADQTVARVDQLSASLQSADLAMHADSEVLAGGGEAPTMDAALDVLQALRAVADRAGVRVDQLAGSLRSADLDAQTLDDVAAVLHAADAMKTAAAKALTGLQDRHGLLHEAVNTTLHTADTDWYRH